MACPLEGTQSALSCFCDPNDRVTLINGATRRVRPDEGPARREALGCWSQPGSGSSGSALNRTLCGVGAGNRTVPCSARDSYLQPRVRALAVTGVVRQTLAPADSAQAPGAGVPTGELQASVRSKAQREGPSLCQGARVPLPGPRPAARSPQDAPDLRAGIGETHGSEMTPDLGTRWHLLEVVPGPGTGLLGAGAASGTAPKCRWNPGPRRTGAGLHRAPLDGRVGPPPGPESPQMQRQGSPVPLLPPQCPPRGQGPQPGEVPWMPTRPGLTRGFRRATSWAWGLLPWGCGASLGTGWGPARRPSLCPSPKLPSLLQRALLLHRK